MAITSTAVPSGAVATVFGNQFNYVDLREGLAGLPQVIAIFAQYDPTKVDVTPNEPVRVFTSEQAGDLFGFGFPAHLSARQVLRQSGIVPVFVFPIPDAVASSASEGNFAITGPATTSGTISFYIGGLRIPLNVPNAATAEEIATALVAAIQSQVLSPVSAAVDGTVLSQVNLTAKSAGLIGDDIKLSINVTEEESESTPSGISFVTTAMTGGAGTPSVSDSLDNFADNWYTYIVNTFGGVTAVLDEFSDFNEQERWDPLAQRFFRSFWGSVDDFNTVTGITDGRKLDRTNGVITSPEMLSLPYELVSNAVGAMASRNQDNPAQPYTGLQLTGLVPGDSVDQWDYVMRDAAIKLGTGTTVLKDGTVELEDVAMHYNRTGEEPPAYRWAVDIAKLAEWAYNVQLVFQGSNWRGKILIDDGLAVSNIEARRPLDVTAEIFKLADAAADAALIVRPEETKANTASSIDVANPNRVNCQTLIILSGADRIISLTTNFGFNFGRIGV